jgi:predicted nucleotide-binding protein (sugar kinase/HSP70/actin superfamily)
MDNYYVPITFLLKKVTDYEVMHPLPITKRTLELGTKYSPEFVCVPFKYNLGNYIESLERGANVLVQAGGGCRYGYYAEVQEQILCDLGYNFEFHSLVDNNQNVLINAYKVLKKINNKLTIFKYIYYMALTLKIINYMDKIDIYIRANIGFEKRKGDFGNLLNKMLEEIVNIKGFWNLRKLYKKYNILFQAIQINKPIDCLKVGLIGELYTSMEPFCNYYLEKALAEMKIQMDRYTNVTYLLITKLFNKRKVLKKCGCYCKYLIGADGTDNVAVARTLALKGYDGLIHTKPFGCMPEVGAMPILQKLSNDYEIPILFFSFDSHTAEEGIKTRLEAFYDMIMMRRNKHD